MNESDTQLADAWKMPAEVAKVFAEKMQDAKETLNERILKAQDEYLKALSAQPIAPGTYGRLGTSTRLIWPSGQSCSGTRYANAATILLSMSGRANRLCSISITRC